MTSAEEIEALSGALGRLLRAWPGGSAPKTAGGAGGYENVSQRFKADAACLVAAPVRYSMVLGIRTIGLRLDTLNGRFAMTAALDGALEMTARPDREALRRVTDTIWGAIGDETDRRLTPASA